MNSKPKGFFKMFKPLLANRNGSFGSNCMLLNVNGTVAKDQNVVVKEFAGYFSTLANNIGDESSLSSTEHNFTAPPSVTNIENNWPTTDMFTFTENSYGETAKALDGLNPSKSTCPDLIPPRILKLAAKELALSPTKIFNLSITSGCYPKRWKRGDGVPIFKKDAKMEKDYLPMTVLNAINKNFQQLLSKQVVTKVDLHLSLNMSAYRKDHHCQRTSTKLIEDWRLAIDKGKFVGVIPTDTGKAFEFLLLLHMVRKLQVYNFSDESLCLLRSYFQD